MKLEKWLATNGVASRRKSKELILEGKITVNDKVIKEPAFIITSKDQIKYNNKLISQEERVYLFLNKPKNIITSVSDEKGRKTVIDLIEEEDKATRIYPVGRLDYNTAGAILLTNDGKLAYILTRPEFEVPKTYVVRIKGIINKNTVKQLERGIVLDTYKTRRSKVKVLERDYKKQTSLVELTLIEGKNHQVKEMFKAVNHHVTSLVRTHFSFLTIEGLARGKYRKLKIHEIKRLYANKNKKTIGN